MRMVFCPLCDKSQPAVADPLHAQAETPKTLLRLTRGLTRAQLLARPAPGKWSIHEIACHLADTEVANAWRYRKVLAEDEVGLTAWDQDRWAAGHQYRRQDLRLALEQFRVLRARNLALLKTVGRKAWSRAARHSTLGTLCADQMLVHLAHHDANHLGQVERIRRALKSRKTRAASRG
jgi:DinB family protein